MRLSKFIALIAIVTVLALGYVFQQTEIFRLAYKGQKDLNHFQELLDANSNLRYNFKQKTSLVSIGSSVSGEGDFTMPVNYCLVRLQSNGIGGLAARHPRKNNVVTRLFGIKRQAEAKTLVPSIAVGLAAE